MNQCPSIDLSHGESVLGDHQSACQLLKLFLEKLPGYMHDIQHSMHRQDWPMLHEQAHSLKGATCYTSTPYLHTLASQLNEQCKDGKIQTNAEKIANLVTKLEHECQQLASLAREHPDLNSLHDTEK